MSAVGLDDSHDWNSANRTSAVTTAPQLGGAGEACGTMAAVEEDRVDLVVHANRTVVGCVTTFSL